MKKDKHKTKVKFVIATYDNGVTELLALFPEITNGKYILFYAHTGQHSDADPSFLNSPSATPEQYKSLAIELEGFGYNLQII